MTKENLTAVEKEILNSLNVRAALIIQIEDILKDLKLPMDKSVLHDMTDDSLVGFLEMLLNMEETRKKYSKDETKSQN